MTAPLSAPEFAAMQIRKSILEGRLGPGARIQQHALAAELGVSHVPLREAIQKLEAEGFLAIHPRRGAFVMPMSPEDAGEIFALRRLLEAEALRASLPNLASDQIKIAREICATADGVTDVVQYGELNVQFHRVLLAGAARPRLLSLIESLWRLGSRYSMLLRFHGQHFEQSQTDHWDLIEAAILCDVERACMLLDEHIAAAAVKIFAILDHNAESPPPASAPGRFDPAPRP